MPRQTLLDAKAASELQEQFMAVLGHDLRNPLAAISSGVQFLKKAPSDDKAQMLLDMMGRSTNRMGSLIEDVIDLARTRLGGELKLSLSKEPLQPVLQQVIDEMLAINPQRKIEAEFHLTKSVVADRNRIARLLSNLLGNAVNYSPPDTPIQVRAQTYGSFSISVTNHGPAIPPSTLEKLFLPYVRGDGQSNQQGLGLGLYIVSQIAIAHAGTIDATSSDQATRLLFKCRCRP